MEVLFTLKLSAFKFMTPSLLTHGFNETESIIAKTMEYLSIPSVVGFEQFFMNHLYNDYKNLGLNVTKYPGLLEVRGTAPNSAIICAHIDRHGLISIGNDEYAYAAQYMREIKYGEEHHSSRKELLSIAERFEGERIFTYDSKTGEKLKEGIIKASRNALKNGDSVFFIDGIDEQESGIPLAYARMATASGDLIKGQIDNTLSLGILYTLFKAGYQGTAYLTTEEEIGKSWVHIAKHLQSENIETQDLIIMDTSPYLSEAPIEEGAIILRTRDRFAKFNHNLTDQFKARCEEMNLPFRVKDEIMLANGKDIGDLGSTELGRLIKEREGRWGGTTIQIPTNMYHTSYESTSTVAVRNYFNFLKHILVKQPLSLDITEQTSANRA